MIKLGKLNFFNPQHSILPLKEKTMHSITASWQIKRNLLIKAEETTDASYGCKPEERPIKDHLRLGVINIDKIAGPSSHEVTAWVKRILGISHAGHSGTLEASS